MADKRFELTGRFAQAVVDFGRAETPAELGAMKVFKVRKEGEEQALNRFNQEVQVLQDKRRGLPELLDFNEKELWMVTEYFPERTLEHHPMKYRGKPLLALKAFLSLVRTVEALHKDSIVHRDIKPANIFIRNDDELVLGDFGIVFLPDQPNRITLTNESVGPHDYMPPWPEIGGKPPNVETSFDIYMLGKLLWCMVSGRLLLPREWFTDPNYNVTELFKDDPQMFAINVILEQCVVEKSSLCTISASDLALMVNTYIHVFGRGGQSLAEGVPRPCHVCGYGTYRPERVPRADAEKKPLSIRLWLGESAATSNFLVEIFVCDNCKYVEFFKPHLKGAGFP